MDSIFGMGLTRAAQLGDGVFETIKIVDGRILNLHYHQNRLNSGLTKIGLNTFDIGLLLHQFKSQTGILRLTVWRKEGKAFWGDSEEYDYHVGFRKNEARYTHLDPLKAVVYNEDRRLSTNSLNSVKSISSLLYIKATNYAKGVDSDLALILNEKDNVIEFSNSNIFLFKENEIYTPKLSEGCLPGTMRSFLLSKELGLNIKEVEINLSDLVNYSTCIASNAVCGVVAVNNIGGIEFKNSKEKAVSILKLINSKMGLTET
jgi:branched-chain amino acid aminotransferase